MMSKGNAISGALHFDYMNINFASARIDFVRVFFFLIPEREQIYFSTAHGGISITIIVVKDTGAYQDVYQETWRARIFIKNYQSVN